MGKASSAKKVARAARAGGSRRPGQRRQLGFPVLMTAVLALGVFLVLFARDSRDANARPLSQANTNFDHWHTAYGVYDCDHFVYDGSTTGGAFFADASQDAQGIHTHGDGVIHIHPFLDSAGGRNARLQIWLEDINMTMTNSEVTFPDGTKWKEGDKKCGTGADAKDGEIVIAVWNSAQEAADGEKPNELVRSNFGNLRFANDRAYITIAFVPADNEDEIPVRPAILDTLNNLSDVPPEDNIDAPSSTTATTVPADGSSTTVPADGSSTTVPADGSSTTATTAAG